jgi:hypothetical protein
LAEALGIEGEVVVPSEVPGQKNAEPVINLAPKRPSKPSSAPLSTVDAEPEIEQIPEPVFEEPPGVLPDWVRASSPYFAARERLAWGQYNARTQELPKLETIEPMSEEAWQAQYGQGRSAKIEPIAEPAPPMNEQASAQQIQQLSDNVAALTAQVATLSQAKTAAGPQEVVMVEDRTRPIRDVEAQPATSEGLGPRLVPIG